MVGMATACRASVAQHAGETFVLLPHCCSIVNGGGEQRALFVGFQSKLEGFQMLVGGTGNKRETKR